ncbi:MAG: Crp/Fnr family transcriptional regulator [Solirubrobacterales bacterium]|nr:Crp/Fnr family transcriptional regulator [Solirubrobacterales bacterium]
MIPIGRANANVCYPLQEDVELAEAIDPDRREAAADALAARAIEVPAGAWQGYPAAASQLGLLVLEGVLVHRVGIEERYSAEVLGDGDVLRSLRDEPTSSTLPVCDRWLVLEPSRLALLDERFVRQMTAFPQLAGRLFARSVLRTRQLAVTMAIVHQARVDVRLHMLFWHLAGRWGRVRADGVVVRLRLTHTILAELVAARRPTVTSALTELARRGVLRPTADGWLLSGTPPADLPTAETAAPTV